MALAKYFSKDALAIMQVVRKGSIKEFESILTSHTIEVALGTGLDGLEAKATIDLLIKLLCRLYPRIRLTDLTGEHASLIEGLKLEAKSINNDIEIVEEPPTASLVIGYTAVQRDNPLFYIGSDGWIAKLSRQLPVGSGTTSYPFAAGAAACLGGANVFRYVFQDFLEATELDDEVQFSLVDLSLSERNADVQLVDFGDVTVVGIGAIGNGIVWSLAHLPHVTGELRLVDQQPLGLSNLQRYIITKEADEDRPKTEIAERVLKETRFNVQSYQQSWAEYMATTRNWKQSMILAAVDSAEDRVNIQAALPFQILNGFTEEGLLGVSRHFDFLRQPCLSCVYMPSGPTKSYSIVVSENLGIPGYEPHVRNYLYYNKPADDILLGWISAANGLQPQDLQPVKGLPMSEFYSNFVCGGILLKLKDGQQSSQSLEAPLAFQSAFAGILLVSELVLLKAGIRDQGFPVMTHIYPLQPLKAVRNPYNHNLTKDQSGQCLCSDKDFRNVYYQKWHSHT